MDDRGLKALGALLCLTLCIGGLYWIWHGEVSDEPTATGMSVGLIYACFRMYFH